MNPPPDSSLDVDRLAEGLRLAHERAAGLTVGERREVLRLWLAHRLRGKSRDEVRRSLEALSARRNELPVASAEPSLPEPVGRPEKAEPVPEARGRDQEVVAELLRAYWGAAEAAAIPEGQQADRATLVLDELSRRLRELVGACEPSPPLREILDRLAGRVAAVDGAVRVAAKESFDRLFEAFSPAAIEAQVGRKGMRLAPFLKSGAYEAWVEKYGQLEAYHRAGRLVSDFRALFQRHVKAEAEERVAS